MTRRVLSHLRAGRSAASVTAALDLLPAIGTGSAEGVAVSRAELEVIWRNGRGRPDRPESTVEASDLTGDGSMEAARGSTADIFRFAGEIVLAATMNGTEAHKTATHTY